MSIATVLLKAGTSSWTVPAGVNNVIVHCIGPGGWGGRSGRDGIDASTSNPAEGGGGGGYAVSSLTVTPGQSIAVNIPTGGTAQKTWFSSLTTLAADFGRSGQAGTVDRARGGFQNVGTLTNVGGNGGPGGARFGPSGGGGSAGPNGPGGEGGIRNSSEGGGGGAANGGGNANSGTGGSARDGTLGGVITNFNNLRENGANGSGGGGQAQNDRVPGLGGMDDIWVASSNGERAGPCGGGGASRASNAGLGSNGSTYGGGAGGISDFYNTNVTFAGAPGAGLIVVQYVAPTPTKTFKFLKAGTTSWTVPANVTSVTAHCIGPGGDSFVNGTSVSSGGGGGSYSRKTFAVTPGQSIPVQIGANGSGNGTWFKSSMDVFANAGSNAVAGAAFPGASAPGGAAGIGDVTYAGGASGLSTAGGTHTGASGGGGAAGPNGAGANGGNSAQGAHGGGGGANGGVAGATPTSGGMGGAGGNNRNGYGGGVGGGNATVAGAGVSGGGGGGTRVDPVEGSTRGGNSYAEPIWVETGTGEVAGPSGGGGAAASKDAVSFRSGNAEYGGGAGGIRANNASATPVAGKGGPGLIVLEYEAGSAAAAPLTRHRHSFWL